MLVDKIKELYRITNELESIYPGRKITPDGHLVGSIGEVLVAEHYGLTLLPVGTETHDAIAKDGTLVQIKATQIDRVALSSEPQHLIVIKIFPDGTWTEIYNSPGALAWQHAGKMQKNCQRAISLSKLNQLMKELETSLRKENEQ